MQQMKSTGLRLKFVFHIFFIQDFVFRYLRLFEAFYFAYVVGHDAKVNPGNVLSVDDQFAS